MTPSGPNAVGTARHAVTGIGAIAAWTGNLRIDLLRALTRVKRKGVRGRVGPDRPLHIDCGSDAHKLAGDALVVEARDILARLYDDGLVEAGHGQAAAGLLPGPRFSAIELPTSFAQHWPAGLYFNVSAI